MRTVNGICPSNPLNFERISKASVLSISPSALSISAISFVSNCLSDVDLNGIGALSLLNGAGGPCSSNCCLRLSALVLVAHVLITKIEPDKGRRHQDNDHEQDDTSVFDKRRGINSLGQICISFAVILPLRLNDYHDDGLYRESSRVIRDADSSRAALPLKRIRWASRRNEIFSYPVFEISLVLKSAIISVSLTKKH